MFRGAKEAGFASVSICREEVIIGDDKACEHGTYEFLNSKGEVAEVGKYVILL